MHRDHEVWRVRGRRGGIIVCTIHERGEIVSVRTTMADGTLLRSQQAADVETARTIAAEWLYSIRDLILNEGVTTH
jgi:hypothetical protein